jgi:hypothetical protein
MKSGEGKRAVLGALFSAVVAVVLAALILWVKVRVDRPDEETRASYEAVAEAVSRYQPLTGVPEEHRARFLEHAGWTSADLVLVDRVLAGAQAAVKKDTEWDGSVGRFAAGPSHPAVRCQTAADRLRRWDAGGALRILRAVRLE